MATVVAAWGVSLDTAAADPKPSFRDQPMQPRVVRDARPGCGPCAVWIAAEGQIVPGTAEALARVLRKLGDRRLPLLIDSSGGAVNDAMMMGRLIRERRLDVAVAESIPDCAGCGPDAALPRSPGAICASACVLVLAGGTARVGGLATHIGVHQMSVRGVRTQYRRTVRIYVRSVRGARREIGRQLLRDKTVSTASFAEVAPKADQDRAARYLGEMGMGADLMTMMMSRPPTRMRWLTPAEELSTSLLTDRNGGETLLAGRAPPAARLPLAGR